MEFKVNLPVILHDDWDKQVGVWEIKWNLLWLLRQRAILIKIRITTNLRNRENKGILIL